MTIYTDTPYGKEQRRSRTTTRSVYESSAAFHEKDDDLLSKINTYRQRQRQANRSAEDFTHRHGKVFDFDAWYRAHFYDEFGSPIQRNRQRPQNRQQMKFGQFEREYEQMYGQKFEPFEKVQHGSQSNSRSQSESRSDLDLEKSFYRIVFCFLLITGFFQFAEYQNYNEERSERNDSKKLDESKDANKNQ